MNPAEQAAAVYEREPCARTFRSDLEAHLLHGIVISTPTAFIMARYVGSSWPTQDIVNPWCNDLNPSRRDCLHIYLAAGDLSEFFTFPHKPVTWCSFERRNILRFYSYQSLKRRCTISTDPTSPPI
jgi:hypothetical protein